MVVVTAKHDPEGLHREVAAGATDHIAKPFMPAELEEVVRRSLKGSKKAVENRRGELRRSAEMYGALDELRRDLDD